MSTIIGSSTAISELFERIELVSKSLANVLISGESGTGKELVARAIHQSGPRREKPFVPINCTAIPVDLLESELFGHVKGSFTGALSDKKGLFEEAHGGTLFLDEIGDLSLPLQAKLLRVLQDRQIRAVGGSELKKVNVRIISATHRSLCDMAGDGKFREDLFYRLNVIPIHVPPLRNRAEDIPLLVKYFISKFSSQAGVELKNISSEALNQLMVYSWPGNVRELENVIERAIVLSKSDTIELNPTLEMAEVKTQKSIVEIENSRPTLEELEREYIKMILQQVNYRKDEAVKILGISRRTLYRKERTYGWVTTMSQNAHVGELNYN